jgi:hypothetical protein
MRVQHDLAVDLPQAQVAEAPAPVDLASGDDGAILAATRNGLVMLCLRWYVGHDDDHERSIDAGGSPERRPPDGLHLQTGPGGHAA